MRWHGPASLAKVKEGRDRRFQLLPIAGDGDLEFKFGQVNCLLKEKNQHCFGLGFIFTTKMSLKKQHLC